MKGRILSFPLQISHGMAYFCRMLCIFWQVSLGFCIESISTQIEFRGLVLIPLWMTFPFFSIPHNFYHIWMLILHFRPSSRASWSNSLTFLFLCDLFPPAFLICRCHLFAFWKFRFWIEVRPGSFCSSAQGCDACAPIVRYQVLAFYWEKMLIKSFLNWV